MFGLRFQGAWVRLGLGFSCGFEGVSGFSEEAGHAGLQIFESFSETVQSVAGPEKDSL